MKAKILTFVRGLKNGTPPRFQSYLKSLTFLLGVVISVNVWGAAGDNIKLEETTTGTSYSSKLFNISTGGATNSNYYQLGSATFTSKSTYTIDNTKTVSCTVTARNYGGPSSDQSVVTVGLAKGGSVVASTTFSPTSTSLKDYNKSISVTGKDLTDVCFFVSGASGATTSKCVGVSKIVFTAIEGGSSCSNKVTITKNAATNGSYTLKAGSATGSEISNGGTVDNCDANATIVVIPQANTHYHCTGVTASNSASVTGPDGSGNYTITYTKGSSINSSISVSFAEDTKYTVNWYANGSLKGTQTNYSGTACTAPTTPESSDCDGSKVFVGWTAKSDYASEDEAPSDLFTDPTTKTIPDGGANYYAVFADASEGAEPTAYTVGATGSFILAAYNTSDKKWYALPTNPTVSSGKITGVEITVSQTSSSVNYVATADASGYTWTIANATNGQTISDGSKYIYHSNGGSSGTNLTYGTSTSYTWTISADDKGNLSLAGTSGNTVNSRGMLMSGTQFGGYSLGNASTSGYYRIQVLPIGAGTTYSNYTTTCCTKLAAPATLSATATSTSAATLNWTGVTYNNGYQYKVDNGGWQDIAKDATSATISGLSKGQHTIYLRAKGTGDYCDFGEEANTNVTTFYTVSAGSCENGSVKVSLDGTEWAPSVDAAAGTTIYLQATPASETYVFSSWDAPTSGSISENKLTGWTGDVTVTAKFILASIPTLNTPTGMSTTPALKSATIQWNEVANASSYAVVCAGATIGNITTTEGVCSCELTGLTSGTDYTWTVQAIGDGENHKSSKVCAEQNFTTIAKDLSSIDWTTPNKLVYNKGEQMDITGMVVTATYNDGTNEDVTDKCTLTIANGTTLSMEDNGKQFRATYTYTGTAEISKYRYTSVTVNAKINWVVNGTPIDPTFASNGKVVLPATDPTSWPCIEDYPFFVGWTSDAITGETTTEPTYVSATTDAVDEATYYAVFAAGTKGAGWTLVKNLNDLSGSVLIVGHNQDNGDFAMGYQTDNSNRKAIAVTVSNDAIETEIATTNSDENAKPFAFTVGKDGGYYTFYDGVNNGYLYAAGKKKGQDGNNSPSSNSNHLKYQTTLDNNGKWAITSLDATTYVCQPVAQGSNLSNNMCFNLNGAADKAIFSAYATAQTKVSFYKQDPDNYTAWITSCPTYYTITIDNQIQNGSVSVSPVKDSYPAGSTIILTANPVTTSGAGYQLKAWDVYYMDGDNTTTLNVVNNQFTMPPFNVIVSAEFEKMPATEITLDISSKQIPQDQQFTLTATVAPATAYIENFEWVIVGAGLSQVGTNTVSGNTVTATFVGTSVLADGSIKAKMGNIESDACTIKIQSSETWEETDIVIATQPTTKAFNEGDNLDIAGLVVNKVETSNYSHERQTAITDYTIWVGETQVTNQAPYTFTHADALEGTKTVTIKYSTFSTSYDVTLTPKKTVTFYVCGTGTPITETEAKAGVVVPEDPATVGDYKFYGWSTTNPEEETQAAPTKATITEGKYHPTTIADDKLYAIYTTSKEGRVYGFYLTAVVDGEGTTKTIGYYSENSLYPTTDAKPDKKPFWFKDGKYLVTYGSGAYPTYYYDEANGAKITATAGTSTKPIPDDAKTRFWTEVDNGDGTFTYKYTDARILAWNNSSYFRAFGPSTYPYNKFTKTQANEYISSNVDWYTSRPSTAVTPTLNWTSTPTTTVQALSTVKNEATSNSTATITYESDNTDVAIVDVDGTVHGLKYGEANITAKVAAVPDQFFAAEISYKISVTRIPTVINFVEDEQPITAKTVYAGNEYQLAVQTNSDATVNYNLATTSYASIDASGKLTVAAATGNLWGNSTRSVTAYAKQDQTDVYERANSNNTGYKYATLSVTIKDNRKEQKDMTFGDNADKEFNSNSGEQIFTQTVMGNVTAVTYAVKEGSTDGLVSAIDAATGEVTVNTDIAGDAIIVATAVQEERTENGTKFIYQEKSVEYTIHVNYLRPIITYDGPALVGGKMRAPQTVTITAQEGDLITYTLDGSTPDEDSELYTEPFEVSESMTIKAIAISSDLTQISLPAELTLTKDVPTTTVLVNDVETEETDLTINAGDIVTIKAPACLFEYSVTDAFGRKVEGKNSASATTNITFANGGTFTLIAQPRWNITGNVGYKGNITELTINVKGAAHLPLSYTGNGTGVKELPYASTSQNLGDYSGDNVKTKIQFKPSSGNDVWMTINILEDPKYLSFYAKHNKGTNTWEVAENVLKVEQSADNANWTTIATFDKDSAITTSETKYEFDTQLKEGTRYIRWTYHQGTGGANLGLGNIVVKGDAYNVYQPNTELPEDYQGDVIVREGGELLVYNFEPFVLNGDLTIEAGGSVETPDEMVVRNLTIEVGQTKSGQIKGNAAITITGDASMQLEIDPATEASQGWYAFAVPFPVDALNGIYCGNTKLTNEVGYAIMDYHGDVRAQGQYGWKKYRGILQPGVFYYLTVGDTDYKNLRFHLKKDGETYTLQNNYSVDYTAYPSSEMTPYDAGYNGVANKTLENVKIEKTTAMSDFVYIYDNANKVFGTTDLEVDDPTFLPAQPFFVVVDADGSFNLLAQPTPATAPRWMAENEVQTMSKVKVTLANESYTDNYYVSASSDAKAEYEQLKDAVKMGTIDNSTKVPQIASVNYNNTILSAEYAQLVNGQATISLLLYAPADGEYTIAATECKDGTIYLTQNGADIWNLKDAYTLTLNKGKVFEYGLHLVVDSGQAPTNINSLNGNNKAQKIFKDQNIYILRDAQMYNTQGVKVQ